MKKIFSFDAETNGLWGQPFAVGAIVYEYDGNNSIEEVVRFSGRCPIEGDVNEWVKDNVLPQMIAVIITHKNYNHLLADFAEFYLANKADAEIVVHMGVPVESNLLRDMHSRGLIEDFDGPYPLMDVAGMLRQAGEDPTSVDSYLLKYGIEDVKNYGSTHNPLYDSEVVARVYTHLLLGR